MGTFHHRIELGSPDGRRFEALDALVDTGATYTWASRSLLERLGVSPTLQRQFQLADGSIILRDVAQVLVRLNGQTLFTLCIFGDEGTEPLLGAYTLEGFGLGVDPINRRLMPIPGFLT